MLPDLHRALAAYPGQLPTLEAAAVDVTRWLRTAETAADSGSAQPGWAYSRCSTLSTLHPRWIRSGWPAAGGCRRLRSLQVALCLPVLREYFADVDGWDQGIEGCVGSLAEPGRGD
jgi:hypothetical protein